MMKLSYMLLAVAASTLAGCQLYFGEDQGSDSWTYCGSDGYYECNDDDCYWRGPECPATSGGGSGSGGTMGGFECDTSTDCAAGCYCGNGVCEEAGFCTQDSDCGNGFTCNESRSSCEPDITATCSDDNGCPSGSFCDAGTCVASCSCMTDADAVAQNYDYCDEARATCHPGTDPAGDCGGAVSCNLGKPSCPAGSVPLIANGCWTGECQVIASCATAPACGSYGTETDCYNDTDCSASYTGINCRTPNNTPCQAGSTDCECDSYSFAACHMNP
jgi:hypothetical protein